jgi:hypothetical protein
MSHGVGTTLATVGIGSVLVGAVVYAAVMPRGDPGVLVAPMEQTCADAAVAKLAPRTVTPSGQYESNWTGEADESNWTIRTTVKADKWYHVTCVVRLSDLTVLRVSTTQTG